MNQAMHSQSATDAPVGGRNNALHQYAMELVEEGLSYDEIATRVRIKNDSLAHRLGDLELLATVISPVARVIANKEQHA